MGTGPYRFAEFKPGDMVKGVMNPTYHMPLRPHFNALEIKGGGDSVSQHHVGSSPAALANPSRRAG